MVEFIRNTAALGYALGITLVVIGLTVGVVALVTRKRDDGFQSIGRAKPPPPRRSPFASGSAETGRIDRIGLGE